MAKGVTFLLVRSVLGAVLGMFYFGFNTGVVNAPEAAIREFCNSSYHQHYGLYLDSSTSDILFTVITSAFIVGGMLGAMLGGMVADRLGRKRGEIEGLKVLYFHCKKKVPFRFQRIIIFYT